MPVALEFDGDDLPDRGEGWQELPEAAVDGAYGAVQQYQRLAFGVDLVVHLEFAYPGPASPDAHFISPIIAGARIKTPLLCGGARIVHVRRRHTLSTPPLITNHPTRSQHSRVTQ